MASIERDDQVQQTVQRSVVAAVSELSIFFI